MIAPAEDYVRPNPMRTLPGDTLITQSRASDRDRHLRDLSYEDSMRAVKKATVATARLSAVSAGHVSTKRHATVMDKKSGEPLSPCILSVVVSAVTCLAFSSPSAGNMVRPPPRIWRWTQEAFFTSCCRGAKTSIHPSRFPWEVLSRR